MSEPDFYAEEFIGWRGWRIHGKRLVSVNGGEVWEPGEPFTATCQKGRRHKHVPWTACSCGIYVTKTLKKLRANGYHNEGALGQVAVWGHMVDGGDGYRAEFAIPKIIYVPHLSWRVGEILEAEYGVPVHPLNPYTGKVE